MWSWVKQQRWLLCSLLILAGLLGWATIDFGLHVGEVSPANFEKIQFGMTEHEVESLLGKPDPPAKYSFWHNADIKVREFKFWTGPQHITVGFAEDGQAIFKEFCPEYPNAYPRFTVYRTKGGWIYDSRNAKQSDP